MHEKADRRAFVRTMVLGASAGAIAGTRPARADEPDKTKADEPKDARRAQAELPTEIEARMALVLARFGKQLDADARKVVRAEVASMVRRAEELRALKLTNGDGPYPVFVPYRSPLA